MISLRSNSGLIVSIEDGIFTCVVLESGRSMNVQVLYL